MSAPVLINRYAHAFINAARNQGYDDQSIWRSAGLKPTAEQADKTVFGPVALSHLSRGIKLLMRDEFFGSLSSPCKPGAFQMMCELAVASLTLEQGLRKSFRFYALLCDEVEFELQQMAHRAGISIRIKERRSDRHGFFLEWYTTFWRGIASWLIGEKIPMLSAQFSQAPQAPIAEYQRAYSGQCRFAAEVTGFTFDSRYLNRPIVRNASDVATLLKPAPIDLVSVTGAEGALKTRLYHLLFTQLQDAQRLISMEEAAEQYHMSTQTLRRRLEEEGASYRSVKEAVRRAFVMQLLDNVDIPLGRVSELSGYAESTELTRAVKTWTGLSPRAYRNQRGSQR